MSNYHEREKADNNIIKVRYTPEAFDSIIEKVKTAISYTIEEKTYLLKMLEQLKRENWLLYMAEIYREDQFDFSIPDFEIYKKYLVTEIYRELLEQLLQSSKDYEDIGFDEIREWFRGMTFDIEFINLIDQKFREINVKIRY